MSMSYPIHLQFYFKLYHTYPLLNCKGHIQISSNHSTINVENENNRVNKMKILQVIYQKRILT